LLCSLLSPRTAKYGAWKHVLYTVRVKYVLFCMFVCTHRNYCRKKGQIYSSQTKCFQMNNEKKHMWFTFLAVATGQNLPRIGFLATFRRRHFVTLSPFVPCIYIFAIFIKIFPVRHLTFILKDCPARFVWLKVVSIDRSLLKGEAPRFSADFVHLLSSERPFKFQRHLIQDFRYGK
jgi:hypothetical protein